MVKIFKGFHKKEYLFIFICLIFIVIQVYVDLKLPEYVSEITILTESKDSEVMQIILAGKNMLMCALCSLLTSFIIKIFTARMATSVAQQLRENLFKKVTGLSQETLNKFTVSSLVTRTTNDVNQVQNFFSTGLQVLIKTPILAVWTFAKISGRDWRWTSSSAIALVIIIVAIMTIGILVLPNYKVIQNSNDLLNKVTRENLNGITVIRANNSEDFFYNKFKDGNKKITEANLYNAKVFAFFNPSITMITNFLTLAVYWSGAIIIQNISIVDIASNSLRIEKFGEMIVFMLYASQLIAAFLMLALIMVILPKAIVSANRINEVLEKDDVLKNGDVATMENKDTILEFKNVSYKYPNSRENTLTNINFNVMKGEKVAVIGSTGSGKSTLVQLIPRIFDVTQGEILLSGVNVKNYDLKVLRNAISFAPQKNMLFKGSAAFNIGLNYETNNNDAEIESAVDKACLKSLIDSSGGIHQTKISQKGVNISGGQKQRLAIARAVYKKAKIMIFDDTFSALDYKTDQVIRGRINKELEMTTITVAQRIESIKSADKIIVVDNGKIVGIGKHDDLLKSCEVYCQIYESQN